MAEILKNLFKILLFRELTDVQVSKEVETILTQKTIGGKFLLSFENLPLFFTSNLWIIQDNILKNNGYVKILTGESTDISPISRNLRGDVSIYRNYSNIPLPEFSLIHNDSDYPDFLIEHYNKNRNTFYLFESTPEIFDIYSELFNSSKIISFIRRDSIEKFFP